MPAYVIDENDPRYEAEVLKRDVLPTMFAMVVEEGVRGVWRIQNAILERLGILITDEFARYPIEVCVQTDKRNGLIKPSVPSECRLDDIAVLVGMDTSGDDRHLI